MMLSLKTNRFPHWIALSISLITAPLLQAEVRLPNILSDHAVLQREAPVRIWGWAAPNEKITVAFHGQTIATTADYVGAWQLFLTPERAGGPYELKVSGSETSTPLVRKDILVGDVWVASGQSNMEFPLKGFANAPMKDSDKEIAAAGNPRLRLLIVKRAVSLSPLADNSATWLDCTPETAKNFSAVAYFFGREIAAKENVPVGLIDSTWGGTPVQSWIGLNGIADDDLSATLHDAAIVMQEQSRADQIRANFAAQDVVLKTAGKPIPQRPKIYGDYQGARAPAALYNGMISPLTRYGIKGVIWYQGETDSSPLRGPNYNRIFSSLITDWRNQWAQGDFPFLFVQISSFTSPKEIWGQVRDAQRRTLNLVNTGMAVSLDLGDFTNVHPPDKQSVASRLALIARGAVYGEKLDYASPTFLRTTTEGKSLRVWLTHAEGLTSRGKPQDDFEVAGDDGNFVSATYSIEPVDGVPTILVSASKVERPVYVRYGWSNAVSNYFYNSASLPLGTFTTQPSQ